MTIQWQQVYTEISPLMNLYNYNLRMTIIIIVAIAALGGALFWRLLKKRNIHIKIGFLHIIPLIIFAYFLVNGLYQSFRSPRAFKGTVITKYNSKGSNTKLVKFNASSVTVFNDKGTIHNKKIEKSMTMKMTKELYSIVSEKKEVYIILMGDDLAFGKIENGKVHAPVPFFLKDGEK